MILKILCYYKLTRNTIKNDKLSILLEKNTYKIKIKLQTISLIIYIYIKKN
jgi:hypothetical protein